MVDEMPGGVISNLFFFIFESFNVVMHILSVVYVNQLFMIIHCLGIIFELSFWFTLKMYVLLLCQFISVALNFQAYKHPPI